MANIDTMAAKNALKLGGIIALEGLSTLVHNLEEVAGLQRETFVESGERSPYKISHSSYSDNLLGAYKLPTSVIDELRSLTAKFFWGNSDSRRRVHWMNWDALCRPKCLGGMGFRDLGIFNEALLGKQAWRLISKPDSLLGRVMKGKYYPNSDFLESSLGLNCSYSWRSIWGAKSLVKEGLIWRVGDGSKIRIFEVPWLADDNGRFAISPTVEGISTVKDLIDENTREWNYELLSTSFVERDVKCILAIPLSPRGREDLLTWAFSMNGNQ
ncbi:uncharacterized protein LOC110720803 [Chenopodium quinoa]|uniref:uncharacterized protein LOC110720803 n=1 Tax=Chenopodium quinoa TaxID=63459 RepID=UPI000B7751E7|nr:uncharacterized protein LOC110720803 [Chenopodium quinoa]